MALMPCTNCGGRFKGEAENVYLQHFVGDQVESYRAVVCPDCVSELLSTWREHGLYRAETGDWEFPDGDTQPKMTPAPRQGQLRRR